MRRRLSRIIMVTLTVLAGMLAASQAVSAETSTPVTGKKELISTSSVAYLVPADPNDPASVGKVPATCLLINNLWFYPDTYTISVWADTECDTVVASIEHAHEIQRSRWWGWETVAQRADPVADVTFNASYFFTKLDYACGGTGIHDYRGGVSSVVIPYGGTPLSGTVVTQLDEINCG